MGIGTGAAVAVPQCLALPCAFRTAIDFQRTLLAVPLAVWHTVRAPGHKADAQAQDTPILAQTESGDAGAEGARTPPSMAGLRSMSMARPTDPRRAPPSIGRRPKSVHEAVAWGAAPQGGQGGMEPALLNEQPRVQFRVDDSKASKTKWCLPFKVATTSQKFAIDILAEAVRGCWVDGQNDGLRFAARVAG